MAIVSVAEDVNPEPEIAATISPLLDPLSGDKPLTTGYAEENTVNVVALVDSLPPSSITVS